jgi:hypothetical protein
VPINAGLLIWAWEADLEAVGVWLTEARRWRGWRAAAFDRRGSGVVARIRGRSGRGAQLPAVGGRCSVFAGSEEEDEAE